MKKQILTTSIILLFSIQIMAQKAYDTEKQTEYSQGTNITHQDDEIYDYEKADKELNRVYRQILNEYKKAPQFLAKLKASQRLWIKFRDAELEMLFPEENKTLIYGSVYKECADMFLTEITVQRINTLKKWLGEVDEFDVCRGSVGKTIE